MNIKRHKSIANLISAALLAIGCFPSAISAETVVAKTTLITACGKLFEIDANAAGLTAEERARIVQKNLDNAIIAAKNRTPSAVRVEMMNRNPVVTLDRYYIVTADGNSAARNRMSQMELANRWADRIRMCLADATAMNDYLALLTGNYPKKVEAVISSNDRVAVATTDMLFPIQLLTPISSATSQLGDRIEAVVSHDVPLGPSYDSYLPAGTIASGTLVPSGKYVSTEAYDKSGITADFHEFRTPDGRKIPINGHILGWINRWRNISIQPTTAECCGNALSINNDNIVKVQVRPSKGIIVGAWKSAPLDPMTIPPAPRFSFRRGSGVFVAQGEPMMLQLHSTTAIAIAGGSM